MRQLPPIYVCGPEQGVSFVGAQLKKGTLKRLLQLYLLRLSPYITMARTRHFICGGTAENGYMKEADVQQKSSKK